MSNGLGATVGTTVGATVGTTVGATVGTTVGTTVVGGLGVPPSDSPQLLDFLKTEQ